MAMGYAAAFANVIESDVVRELVTEEFDTFYKAIEDEGLDFEEVVRDGMFGGIDNERVRKACEDLQQAFYEKTQIRLYLGYHDADSEGDRYDDIDGVYFYLHWNDIYQYTDKAEKLGVDKFNLLSWVVWG